MPQEPDLPLNTIEIEVQLEANILEDATKLLKGFATSMFTATLQLHLNLRYHNLWPRYQSRGMPLGFLMKFQSQVSSQKC